MAWLATTGIKTLVKICGTSPLLIEGMTEFTAAGFSKSSSEWTPISSTGRKGVRVGRPVLGKITGGAVYDPADPSHAKLISLFNENSLTDRVIGFEACKSDNGSEILQWNGIVDSLGLSFPNNSDPVKLSFSIAPTSTPTTGAATVIVPSTIFSPAPGEGTQLAYYSGSAYVKLNGVENLTLTCGAKDTMQLPEMSQTTAAGNIVGIRGPIKGSFDLLYDSTETNHTALRTAVNSATAAHKFMVTMADAGAATITLDPSYIDGWEPAGLPGANRVKVSFTSDCDLIIVP